MIKKLPVGHICFSFILLCPQPCLLHLPGFSQKMFPHKRKGVPRSVVLLITIIIFHFPRIPKQPFVHYQVHEALNASKYSGAFAKAPQSGTSLATTTQEQMCTEHRKSLKATCYYITCFTCWQ